MLVAQKPKYTWRNAFPVHVILILFACIVVTAYTWSWDPFDLAFEVGSLIVAAIAVNKKTKKIYGKLTAFSSKNKC
jgi:hypothetical protein